MPSDWKSLVNELTKIQKTVHLAMRMDTVDEHRIASEIFSEKRKAYESTLTDLAKKAGCNKTGRCSSATLSEIKTQSNDESSGIIATYNRDLVYEIKRISSVYPKANRHVYAINLRDWDKRRSAWKSVQISLHNTGEWSSRAVSEFYTYNDITGTAKLVPVNVAICDICNDWIKRGTVKLEAAKKAIQSWPPHLGCVHSWEIKLGKVSDCTELWVGAEAGDFKEIGEKGGPGSGFHGHAGRPGKIGGSSGIIDSKLIGNMRKLKTEQLVVLRNGEQIADIEADSMFSGEDFVSMPERWKNFVKGADFVHNHTSDEAPSTADFKFAAWADAASEIVITPKYVYIISRPKNGWPTTRYIQHISDKNYQHATEQEDSVHATHWLASTIAANIGAEYSRR